MLKKTIDRVVRLGKWLYLRPTRFPNWQQVIAKDKVLWQRAIESANGPHVLIATSVGGLEAMTIVESMLAVALTLRGARVQFLLCDEVLPACLLPDIHRVKSPDGFAENGPQQQFCAKCYQPAFQCLKELQLPIIRLSELLSPAERMSAQQTVGSLPQAHLQHFEWEGFPIGEQALAGALRYFSKGTIDDEPTGERVLRRYVHASLLTAMATRQCFQQYQFDCAVFHHGIYVPQGLIGIAARKSGVRVVNWNPAYRKRCFIFSHEDTYHHTLMTESPDVWRNMEWNSQLESEISSYLRSRRRATRDWVFFGDRYPEEDAKKIAESFGIDLDKPLIGLLTNVVWDAQLHYPQNVFANMLEWLTWTVEYFRERSDLQLVIRVHPAEVRGTNPSRQRVIDELKKTFGTLPPNAFIIPPENAASTYTIMDQCNSVIIYGTKTGVELTAMGIPTIVAGEAWIRGKGLTEDATSKDSYRDILDRLPLKAKLDAKTKLNAAKYAYHFFFRRMIPMKFIEPSPLSPPPYLLSLQSISELAPGNHPGLDTIADGILHGSPFVYNAQQHGIDG